MSEGTLLERVEAATGADHSDTCDGSGRAVVDLAAEPQFRFTLSERASAEIERLERANAAAVARLGNVIIGSPGRDEAALLKATEEKPQP